MRLINIWNFTLKEFVDDDSAPPYIILSHTWGADEVTFQDLSSANPANTTLNTARPGGWAKFERFCILARTASGHGHIKYGWMDTCCIDKSSSSELTEAINSMYRWYQKAIMCIAYLEDVESSSDGVSVPANFENARWFSRGWTLQELLAPDRLDFFDKNWVLIGERVQLADQISHRTKIDRDIVQRGTLHGASVAQKMSWAAERRTTRAEDMAYCLMGVFDVNMPLLYGEGRLKAFMRLQEEILKDSDDQSIFAWDSSRVGPLRGGMLAPSPARFRDSSAVEPLPDKGMPPTITSRGIHMQLPIIQQAAWPGTDIALLSCCYTNRPSSLLGIKVERNKANRDMILRIPGAPVTVFIPNRDLFKSDTVYLARGNQIIKTAGYAERYRLFWEANYANFAPLRTHSIPVGRWIIGANAGMTLTLSTGKAELFHYPSQWATISAVVYARAGSLDAFCVLVELQSGASLASLALVNLPGLAKDGQELEAAIAKLVSRERNVPMSTSDRLVIGKLVITARAETRQVEGDATPVVIMSSK